MGMGRMTGRCAAVLAAALVSRPAVAAVSIIAIDSWGKTVDMARSRASIERTPPERAMSDSADAPKAARPLPDASGDPDAIRFVLGGSEGELPQGIMIVAADPAGTKIDQLEVAISDAPCPSGQGPVCRATPPIRAVADDIDRNHPLIKDRSIRAEVGGVLSVLSG